MPDTQRQQVGSRGQCSSCLLPLVLILLSLATQPSQAAINIPPNFKRPPVIKTQPESVTVFSTEDFVMNCEASGNPSPIFRWAKDGEDFDPGSDPELKVSESSGSFAFYTLSNTMDTLNKYKGKYVCYASNELGTAVSNEAILNTDVPPSQQKDKKVDETADEGKSFILKCNPPQSSMEPIIHWMDLRLRHIELSKRVMVGKDGNLYFANLESSDSRDDYTCNVQYLATRTILAKEPTSLKVTHSNSVLRNRRPQMMRPTGHHSTYHALRGQTLELECIVEGLPTPEVSWMRRDGELSETRTTKDMFDRRLRFTNISESDGGEYQCIAENSQGNTKHIYMLTVEAAPYWIKEPVSQLYAPGETVRLDCQADGIPSPLISWTINGVPISGVDKDPRRTLTASGSLILEDVNFGDTAIYQCRASNKHGTILTNTNVYVIELPPQILTDDGNTYAYTEGQKALLECETFGSPKPKVIWERNNGSSSLLADRRVNPLSNGWLEIANVTHGDDGIYTCTVPNSNLSISVELEIFNRTVIQSPPQALKVRAGERAIFTCTGLVDPRLDPPFIQWRKNNQKLADSNSDEKYTMEGPDLKITNVQPDDEGVYTCEIITKLDVAEARGTLTLWDRHKCSFMSVECLVMFPLLPWDNYVVEFEDQRSNESVWKMLARVSGNKERAVLSLWPFMSYRFRIIAINDVGKSDPSKPSGIHNTPAEAPDNNPQDVKSESIEPNTLVITWKKMNKTEVHGPGFTYCVQWRQAVGGGPDWHERNVTEPPFRVDNVGNFSAYEIKVQAFNEIGRGPEPDPVIGYSGEDVPLEAPMDVGVEIINSTTIKVTWAPIDKETVRGHLLGYKVLPYKCSVPLESTVVVKTEPNEKKKVISDLRPFSNYTLKVTVYNIKGEGPFSEALPFETPEGVPGPPLTLTLDSPSETEMTLHWTPPGQPNGVLIGYLLQYQQSDDDSPMQVETIDDPTVTHITLKNLDHKSHYRFYLRGRTAAGDGVPTTMKGATMLDGGIKPIQSFNILSVGENAVNFSWVPEKRRRNVGFQIQYRNKNDGNKWKTTEKVNSSQSFYQIQGLTPGSYYSFQFIYNNTTFFKAGIETEGTGVTEMQPSFATQGWFIGVVSAIGLLLLILLILCFIKRSKGGKYSGHDLEEKRTASQPSLCEKSKLYSEDNLDFNGSSAMTTELNMDESLASQISRPSGGPEGFHGLPENAPLNPSTFSPATNGVPNSVTILD
uniref:L1 cell adhesion molecule, paralog a n=1 Tax=Neolamprologus brichardi TaxID=32507 RepID=A0A3Q4MVS7_NEOBR